MDVLNKEQRHYNMSQIRSGNTKPEIIVRKYLWKNGFRYRLHRKDLPGKPDIVLSKYQTVIFVNGCFWHMHKCKNFFMPATNTDFWREKLSANKLRDKKNYQKLKKMGWHVITIWECRLNSKKEQLLQKICNELTALLQ
ncbi:very short patch repair endonuclease [Spirochaetia bacterium]|nr:very short patch repair endonuclease [Spirochaetia bacterium]